MKRIISNPILNDTVTFLQTARESGGEVTELEIEINPGGNNPPHFHRKYDETIFVIQGVICLTLGKGHQINLFKGDSYVIKSGQVHSLCNNTNNLTILKNQIKPGHEGFETSLRIMYGLASDGLYNEHQMPGNLQYLAVCAVMSDTWLPGILYPLNLILIIAAKWAKMSGAEKHLKQRYCI